MIDIPRRARRIRKVRDGKAGATAMVAGSKNRLYHNRGTTMFVKRTLAALALTAFMSSHAVAADVSSGLNAETAQKIVQGCIKHAMEKKQSQAIAVVDGGGALLAFIRMDGNPPGVGEFSIQKAVSAARWHSTTERLSLSAINTPGFGNAPGVVTVGGGVSIYSADGKQFLGAIGVSGESSKDDVECANAGIVSAALKY